jgi:hypothetical protein
MSSEKARKVSKICHIFGGKGHIDIGHHQLTAEMQISDDVHFFLRSTCSAVVLKFYRKITAIPAISEKFISSNTVLRTIKPNVRICKCQTC